MARAWITTGAQIRAARALLGCRRQDLAAAAGLHPNAVAYWERRKVIPAPPDRDTPHACRQIAEALRLNGVVVIDDPGPGVALKADSMPELMAQLKAEGAEFDRLFGSVSDKQLPLG
jgi:transcriptional regulator with XRE-family HTH domain